MSGGPAISGVTNPCPYWLVKADAGTRTPDPFITSEVLYQLSYVGAAMDASDVGRYRLAAARATEGGPSSPL